MPWLNDFLSRRDLPTPDGRPLYAYRCDANEYADLQREVGLVLGGALHRRRLLNTPSALFCLFASEWWRRNYQGGPYSWHQILTGAGIPDIAFPQLYLLVELGLRYWQRELLMVSDARGFLVTLACEGGLPLQLVKREGAHLRRFFRALLNDVETYRTAGIPAERLASQLADYLPRSFQQDQVFMLSGQLAGEVWRLQRLVTGESQPLAALDRIDPGWREKMPLLLEETTARAFLDGLVNDASSIARTPTRSLKAVRTLRRRPPYWELAAKVSPPGLIAQSDLFAIFGDRAADLSARFDLFIATESGEHIELAWATRRPGEDASNYLIERIGRQAPTLSGFDAGRAVRIGIRQRDARFDPAVLPGGSELSDLPWTFVDREGDGQTLHFLTQGAARTRFPCAWVAITEEMRLELEPGGSVESAGDVRAIERMLMKVSGSVVVVDREGTRCRVCCGAESETQEEFRLLADRIVDYGPAASSIFLGMPRLLQLGENGPARQIPTHQLEWRPRTGGSAWRPFNALCLGTGVIRLIEDGELRYRQRIAMAPEHFQVRYGTDATVSGGSLTLSSIAGAQIGYKQPDDEQVSVKFSPGTDTARFELIAGGKVPSKFKLSLRWHAGAELQLEVPFPACGGRFLDPSGEAIPTDRTLPLDRLAGITAHALSTTGNDRFFVTGSPVARDLTPDLVHGLWLRKAMPAPVAGHAWLDLRTLKVGIASMLSASTDLDACVKLKIKGGASDVNNGLTISRYDIALAPNPADATVSLSEGDIPKHWRREFVVIGTHAFCRAEKPPLFHP